MSSFVNFDTKKHKKSILFFFLLFVIILSFYQFILLKTLDFLESKEEYSNSLQLKNKLELKLEKEVNEVHTLEESLLEYKNIKEKESKNKEEKKAFSSDIEVEKFLAKFLAQNSLEVNFIGRIEKNERSGYFFFPYTIKGMFENFINFFSQVENLDRNIRFDISPILLSIDSPSLFEGKICAKLDNNIEYSPKEIEGISFADIKPTVISQIKKVSLNNMDYLIIYYIDKSTLVLRNHENIKIRNKNYQVEIGKTYELLEK